MSSWSWSCSRRGVSRRVPRIVLRGLPRILLGPFLRLDGLLLLEHEEPEQDEPDRDPHEIDPEFLAELGRGLTAWASVLGRVGSHPWIVCAQRPHRERWGRRPDPRSLPRRRRHGVSGDAPASWTALHEEPQEDLKIEVVGLVVVVQVRFTEDVIDE